jgi:hypothetical protein
MVSKNFSTQYGANPCCTNLSEAAKSLANQLGGYRYFSSRSDLNFDVEIDEARILVQEELIKLIQHGSISDRETFDLEDIDLTFHEIDDNSAELELRIY